MTKYPVGVARALAVRRPEAQFSFVYDYPDGLSEVEFPLNSTIVHRGAPTPAAVRELVSELRPDMLVTTAQRIPDSAFVSAAREAGIFTAMFQHGLYLPFMRREADLFLRKAGKTLRYARYASAVGALHSRSRARYVAELARTFIAGKPYAEANIDHDRLNVDLVLLNGEYWRQYHTAQFRYPHDAQVVVGYPDYDQLPEIEASPLVHGVCYVAQTLVEHGRLGASQFRDFLLQLRTAVGKMPLVVKLHPASDLRLYSTLEGLENVSFSRDRLPRATHYVGHYSTYLSLVPFLSRKLYLWELAGHPVPTSMRAAGAVIGSDPESLARFVGTGGSHEPRDGDLSEWQRIFYRPPTGSAFEAAADALLEGLARHPRTDRGRPIGQAE